jgi:hypothetical protein
MSRSSVLRAIGFGDADETATDTNAKKISKNATSGFVSQSWQLGARQSPSNRLRRASGEVSVETPFP